MRPPRARSLLLWSAILALAVGFRVWGLHWGAPREDLNHDEMLVLQIASRLSWEHLNPRFFAYCGFIFNQSFLTTEALKLAGIALAGVDRLLMHRAWSVFWGVATVPLVYHLARKLGGSRRAAFIAGAFMAITPLHVWECHFGTTDSPLLFWMTASLLASLAAYVRPTPRAAALAGALAGIAVGTKYPGAFASVPFAAAIALAARRGRLPDWHAAAGRIAVFCAAAIAASFVVSPFSYLDARGTIAAFLFEYRNVDIGHFGFDLRAPGWQYHRYVYELGAAFPFGFGTALYALIVPSLVFVCRQVTDPRLIALAFLAFFFGVTGSWTFVPVRYFMPLFPVLIVAAGIFLDWLLERAPAAGAIVGTVVAVYTLAFTFTTTRRFSEDTRLQAAAWAERSLAVGSTVFNAHPRSGFSYTVRLDESRFQMREAKLNELNRLVNAHSASIRRNGPKGAKVYVVASSMNYDRYYRSGDADMARSWDRLRRRPERFRRIRVFESRFLNKPFYTRLDPMFAGYFVSPRLEFYEVLRF
jgi:hypothetical protein